MDTRAYLAERQTLVDHALDAWLPAAEEPPEVLHAAMRHLLFPGGKRLRPALAFAAAEAVGAVPERALPAAAAVELVHTYSLVHDDLPCMDDDDVRRGRPSVHVAFGEANAVLAGDALLAAAFECLARDEGGSDADQRLLAARDLSVAAGSLGLVGGQVDDLVFDSAETEPARIESVHARKSAALIAASITCGARLGGADESRIERMGRCGELAGVAFQIADDVLDAGEDDPCSLVHAIGVAASTRRGEELLAESLELIEGFGEPAEALRGLLCYALRRSE